MNITRHRLLNQQIALTTFEKPADVVEWLGAVQSQDYAGAKWALGLRMQSATDEIIEQAFTDGAILRTHVMRPTWHFVTPADIRWIIDLTAPRINAVSAYYYRKIELDETVFKRSRAAMIKVLQGGKQLNRDQLQSVFQQAGIATEGELRMSYIMMRAELDGLVCSGPRRGKQFTYMLLEERAPRARTLKRDEALAELTRRYFLSHGPATVQDFVWWSGLTVTDARRGIEMIKSQLSNEVIDGQAFWFSLSMPSVNGKSQAAYLLPNYDEYGIGYKNRDAMIDSSNIDKLVFGHLIIINGRVAGTWKRTLKKSSVVIETDTFTPLTRAEKRAVAAAASQYGAFLNLPVVLQ